MDLKELYKNRISLALKQADTVSFRDLDERKDNLYSLLKGFIDDLDDYITREYQTKLEEHNVRLTRLQEREKKNSDWSLSLTNTEKALDKKSTELQHLKEQLGKKEKDLEDYEQVKNRELAELVQRIDHQQKELQQLKSEKQKVIRDLDSRIQEKTREEIKLTGEIQRKKEEGKKLAEQLGDYTKKFRELEALKQSLQKMESELGKRDSENRQREESLSSLETEAASQSKDLDSRERSVRSREGKLSENTEEVRDREGRVRTMEKNLAEKERELAIEKARYGSLMEELIPREKRANRMLKVSEVVIIPVMIILIGWMALLIWDISIGKRITREISDQSQVQSVLGAPASLYEDNLVGEYYGYISTDDGFTYSSAICRMLEGGEVYFYLNNYKNVTNGFELRLVDGNQFESSEMGEGYVLIINGSITISSNNRSKRDFLFVKMK